LASKDFDK